MYHLYTLCSYCETVRSTRQNIRTAVLNYRLNEVIASRGPLSTAWTDFELTNQIASFNLVIRGSIFIRSHARILRTFWQRYKGSEEATFERDWRGEHVSATEAYSDIGSCSTHRPGKNTKLLNFKKKLHKSQTTPGPPS